ncbi:fibronectin type III domain-containing protein [Paragemmobacter ruber]|uniref:Fibronectin type-III domain-containing protein n=1 Tax=Paragemmobacter ruber TaxID=1985673 RepID=A0ABW9Y0A1_9RHOB|nr:fibronectin type III domain-containing protein [Rhodobacter ruber]NBE05923.1 hypothetical protein [Rhodobacter ruber]
MWFKPGLLACVLLFCVAPDPAHAAPVLGFIGSIISGVIGAFGAGGFFSTIAGRLALVVGLNALSARMAQRRVPQPTPQDVMSNQSQPLSAMERVYGRVRKGGPKGFTGFFSATRFYSVIIAAHRTKGPVEHWLDKTQVMLDAAGAVTTAPIAGFGAIRTYRGLPGQGVDPGLDAAFAEIGPAHNFAGLSHAVIEAKKPPQESFQTIYPNSREWEYAPVWEGHDQIYDPRTATYGYTDNAALVIAHEASVVFGKPVDWAVVAEEAAICDQIVTDRNGVSRKRWAVGAVIRDDMNWEDVRAALGLACDAFFWETPLGEVGFRVGRWIAPTVTLTAADFLSVQVSDSDHGPDLPGEFCLRYTEPANGWLEGTTGAIVITPNGKRRVDDCFAVTNHNQGCRITKRIGRQQWARWRLSGVVKLIGYECIGQRFLRIDLSSENPAWVFDVEVKKLSRDAGGLTFRLEAVSASAADFAFNAAVEEPEMAQRGEVGSVNVVPEPVGLWGRAVQVSAAAVLRWRWPAQAAGLIQDFRYRKVGETDWTAVAVAEGQTVASVRGLISGEDYEAQARNREGSGRVSGWWPAVPVPVVLNPSAAAPAALPVVSVTAGTGRQVNLSWMASPAPYFGVRIWRGTTTVFSEAAAVLHEIGAAGASDSVIDAPTGAVPQQGSTVQSETYVYWIEPINSAGISGPRAGPFTVILYFGL